MGMQAVYMAVDDTTLESLKKMDGEDLFEAIEDLEDGGAGITDIDKMWDGLHFLLTGVSAEEPIEGDQLSEFVVGVNLFSEDEDAEFISYTTKEELKRILEKIEKIKFSVFEKRFDPAAFAKKDIYPNIWIKEDNELLINELKEAFENLKEFYKENIDSNIVVSIY